MEKIYEKAANVPYWVTEIALISGILGAGMVVAVFLQLPL